MTIQKVSDADYFSNGRISRSSLWTIHNKSPMHYKMGKFKETDAMRFGTAYQMAILEPERFDQTYCVKDWDGRTSEGKARAAYVAETGMRILSDSDYSSLMRMRDVIMRNPQWNKILTNGGQNEIAGFAADEETGLDVQCKIDRITDQGLVIDLKTTADARPHKFIRSVADYGYHMQEAFYRDVWSWAGGAPIKGFIFLAQETKAPFDFIPYELTEIDVSLGRDIYRRALNTMKECMDADEWPGYEKRTTNKIELPKWAVE